jgi:hypothetical protein
MTRFRFLVRSLRFYWRTNLAVLLGVIAGTAVIGGALIVAGYLGAALRGVARYDDADFRRELRHWQYSRLGALLRGRGAR